MSDGYAIRPTDEELAAWTSGTVAQGFPEYYEDRHYELLDGMFEELIELRAAIANAKPRTVNSASELDDLAEGSVIRTAQGAVYEKSGALWVVSPIHFGKASHYAKFPATVLFDSGDVS